MIRALFDAVQERAVASGEVWVFYSGAPWNAGGGGQRPQQLAQAAADAGHAVVHMCPSNANLIRRDGVIVRNSREWQTWAGLDAQRRVLVISYPDLNAEAMIQAAGDDWVTVYDCLDDWSEFVKNSAFGGLLDIEQYCVSACQHMTATAQELVRKWQPDRAAASASPAAHLPNSTMMAGLPWAHGKRTVDCIGIGWWADCWVQWDYVEALCEAGLSVQLIGKPPQQNRLVHERLEWLGMMPWRQCMEPLSRAKVGIVPFRDMPLVTAVDPVKYYDYLAAGLPTVATHMPELEERPFATVVHDAESFVEAVQDAVASSPDREAIRREARRNTYTVRFAQLREVVGNDAC